MESYQAIVLDPNNALYYLGQASLSEQHLDFLQQRGLAPVSSVRRTIMLTVMRDTYLLAYDLALNEDLSREYRMVFPPCVGNREVEIASLRSQ
jgi:hypothetical protein